MPAHIGVEYLHAGGAAVVVHEDDERVLGDAPLVEFGEEPADVLVDIVDHAEEVFGGGLEALALVERPILGACGVGAVGGVRWDVGEEGFFRAALGVDPLRGLGVEEVGAVARGFLELSVVEQSGIKIRVAGRIAAGAGINLADAAAAVDVDLVEAAAVGLIRRFVAEMPFAKNPRGVTGRLQHLRQRGGGERHALAFENRVGDAVLKFMAAGEEGAACRGARGADVEIRETHALGAEAIEVGRLQDGISVGGDVAVTLIIGKDEKNIRLGAGDGFGGSGGGCGRDGEKERQSDGENGAEGIHRRRGFVVRRWGRGGLECAFEAEGPERAEVEARAELGVRGRIRPGDFGVLGGVVEVAQIGKEREAARE